MTRFSDHATRAMTRAIRAGRGRLLVIGATAAALVIGFAAGMLAGRDTASMPEECTEALRAADAIVDALESEWQTASGAVDAAQKALADSDYRHLAEACRE